ncbi:hypothetical protein [Undibacterium crateris]|uniref:hypothetical protein n=1 Tax=Undibacterium crateris TaxID=2528175 RepID=UPI00138A5694|nr:hypothetical protein [Undibacterium crateris]NDI84619.1 hypothetical protein [Undibacterium crateris]
MKKNIQRGLAMVGAIAVSSLTFAGSAQAAGGPDLSSLTGAVDMTSTITAVLAISATLAGLFVAIRGAKTVVGMIKGR